MRQWMQRTVSGLALSCATLSPALTRASEYDPFHLLRTAQRVEAAQRTDVRFQLTSMLQEDLGPTRQLTEATADLGQVTARFTDEAFENFAQQSNPAPQAPSSAAVTESQVAVYQPNDVGAALTTSNMVQTVATQRRSPVALEPYVRGYRWGQLYSQYDGAYFFTVRPDLDSMLNKIDPSLIGNVTVIPGPYGLRYGPGFAFIDVTTIDTPRYDHGFEAHHRAGITYRTNGDQIFGRETVYGGSTDYGFIVNYGNRTGVDYEAGDGTRIPSSYKMQTFLGQIGFDLSEDSRIEFRYNRLDGSGIEVAGQIFDVDFMTTDNFLMSYIAEDPVSDSYSRADVWYNRSRLLGTTALGGKRGSFHVLDRIDEAVQAASPPQYSEVILDPSSNSDGDATSAGIRGLRTYGQDDWVQMTIGADARYTEQHIQENFAFSQFGTIVMDNPDLAPFSTNLPRAEMVNPGAFVEWKLPMLEYWDLSIGGRVDWVHTSADRDDLRLNTIHNPDELGQSDVLHSFYVTNDLDLTENFSTRFGFGYAERPPTLLERYADGVFLGLIQSGFSRLLGTQDLRRERNWQVDFAVQGDWDVARGRAAVFHSWILDYVTYEGNVVSDPSGARLLRTTNTDLATLAGFELYGEYDLTEYVAAFATMRYVEGRDHVIEAPLPHILPLENRAGIRLHNPANEIWGLETGMRIVDNQDRIAGIRTAQLPGEVLLIESPTPGFTTFYVRGFYNVTPELHLIAGVENLFDKRYLEHVDLRLPADANFGPTEVLSPGITPYFGIEWNR